MKTLGLIGLMGLTLCGCDDREQSLIRNEAIREIAENMGKAEEERFLKDSLALELRNVEIKRAAVAHATDDRELALAEDSLREARREVRKIEGKLEELAK